MTLLAHELLYQSANKGIFIEIALYHTIDSWTPEI